jgi:hypothetical protein
MGLFREMKDMLQTLRSDELKELKKKADAQPRTSMLESVKAANQAVDQAQELQRQAAGLQEMIGDPNSFASTYMGGTRGNAVVNSITDTGAQVHGSPVMELDLTVTVPGRGPYPVKHRQLIAYQAMGNFQPGKVFPVHVDQHDPTKLVIG